MQILFIISKSGYQEIEFNTPKKILEDAGHHIDVASLEKWQCTSWSWSETYEADFQLKEVKPDDYSLIVFIWWNWTYNDFIWNENYYHIAKNAKNIWAICIAPTIISHSWVLKWKKVTWWDNWGVQQKEIEDSWAIYTWNDLEIDWNIITASGPHVADAFWKQLLDLINNV